MVILARVLSLGSRAQRTHRSQRRARREAARSV